MQTNEAIGIKLSDIAESTLNPRKQADPALQELADSITKQGVLQPILVRPISQDGKKPFEIVCGSRRFKASQLAKQETIPAIVRTMNDAEALEAILVENLQRRDIHFLDEAHGFQRLLDTGNSQEDIAVKVGKSLGYVATRLSLARLIKPYHPFALSGELTVSVALRLSRLTSEIQNQYFQDTRREEEDRFHMPSLDHWLHDHVYLNLAQAPFDTASDALVPKAGNCLVCPKRTGASLLLFAEFTAKGADNICTDPSCFTAKCDALVQVRLKENPEAIQIVLSDRGWLRNEIEKEADKRGILRPFDYNNSKKGYRPANEDVCEHTKLAIVAMGSPHLIGTKYKVCIAPTCPTHTGDRSRRVTSTPREPGTMDPTRVQQQEELYRRRMGHACRVAVHAAIRLQQAELAKTAKPNPVVPIGALRLATARACQAMRPQKEGSEFLNSVWLSKQPREIGWGGSNVLPLLNDADQTTCLQMLLDFALADDVASKYHTQTNLDPAITKAYKLDVDRIVKPVMQECTAKYKASVEKRKARLAKEREKAKRLKQAGVTAEQAKAIHALHTGNCCKFCGCTDATACQTDAGPCTWLVKPKKLRGKKEWKPGVCSAPKCAVAFQKEKKAAKKEAR